MKNVNFQIEFLVINRNTAKLNKGNKEVLKYNARMEAVLSASHSFSEAADATISRIVRKVCKIREDETLLRRVTINNNEELPACDVSEVENELLQLEQEVTEKMTIEDAISMISNIQDFNPQWN